MSPDPSVGVLFQEWLTLSREEGSDQAQAFLESQPPEVREELERMVFSGLVLRKCCDSRSGTLLAAEPGAASTAGACWTAGAGAFGCAGSFNRPTPWNRSRPWAMQPLRPSVRR